MSEISEKYLRTGGSRGPLGPSISSEITLPDKKGKKQDFKNGSIYYHPSTGAHYILNPILSKWIEMRAQRGEMGYPISDSLNTPNGKGKYCHFQKGSIFQKTNSTPHVIWGAVRDKWYERGAENGFMGFPKTDELTTANGRGKYNDFDNGSIYWTPQTGAHEVHGLIRDKWLALGAENSHLGFPITDELPTPDTIGRFNHFEGGSIYWTPQTGAWEVHGEIRNKWEALRWERGVLGYPVSDEITDNSGGWRMNKFQSGTIKWRFHPVQNFRIYFQNAALMIDPIFNGDSRIRTLSAFKTHLKQDKPDLAGLCEMFYESEVDELRNGLKDIYPYSHYGPDEADIEETGAVLILSKHPFTIKSSSIYRTCDTFDAFANEDCLANKGVLHVRIQPNGHPTPIDYFFTHTQNPDAGGQKDSKLGPLYKQLSHLNSMVMSFQNPQKPIFITGDINVNMLDNAKKQELMSRMRNPWDLWEKFGDKVHFPLGITTDKKKHL